MYMSHELYVTHKNIDRKWVMNESHTGWRRLIGSPKLQIIFHKRATKYRSLLRKMTYKDKGSYESSPPCISLTYFPMYINQNGHGRARAFICSLFFPLSLHHSPGGMDKKGYGQVWMSHVWPGLNESLSPYIFISSYRHESRTVLIRHELRCEVRRSSCPHIDTLSFSAFTLSFSRSAPVEWTQRAAARLQWVKWQLVACIQFVTRIHRSKRAMGAPEHLQKERRLGLNESRDSFVRVAHTVRSHSSWLMWQIEHESWISHVIHVYISNVYISKSLYLPYIFPNESVTWFMYTYQSGHECARAFTMSLTFSISLHSHSFVLCVHTLSFSLALSTSTGALVPLYVHESRIAMYISHELHMSHESYTHGTNSSSCRESESALVPLRLICIRDSHAVRDSCA